MSGWAPVELIEVRHNEGDAVVRIESWPVADDASLEAVASAHLQLSADVPGWVDSGLQPAEVLGRPDGLSRDVSWLDDQGSRVTARMTYQLDRGRVVTTTSLVPSSHEAKSAEADAIAASVNTGSLFDQDRHDRLPLRESTDQDFSAASAYWQRASADRPDNSAGYLLTNEEALAAARHYATALLPGTDPAMVAALDASEQQLVLGVAWRSLTARGAETEPGFREALELAASHDLLVTVSRNGGSGTSEEWYAARSDRMVHARRDTKAGSLTYTTYDTKYLVDLLLPEGEQLGDITIRTLFRRGMAIAGGELRRSADASWASARAELLAALPATQSGH